MSVHPYIVGGGRVEHSGDVWRLLLPPCGADAYCDAQLDDYSHRRPFQFVNQPPQLLQLRARFSHPIGAQKGTAGFGFWNHPLALGGGLIPRSVWFFHGSAESDLQFARNVPGHGFKAGMLDVLPLGRRPARAVETTPSNLATTPVRRWPLALVIRAAQRMFHARERILELDVTQWHDYALDWRRSEAVWSIDGREVFRAPRPPRARLGFVAWIDNYRAQFTADGRFGFAYVASRETQWLDIELRG